MVKAILSLGSNIEPRQEYLEAMERQLAHVLRAPLAKSRLMETQPVAVGEEHGWYFNRIVSGWYEGSAHDLLSACNEIERNLGRNRPYELAPRTADIDILLFGESLIDAPGLRIPHAGLLKRRFCLEGVLEIAPRHLVAPTGLTVAELYYRIHANVLNQKIIFCDCQDRVQCSCL